MAKPSVGASYQDHAKVQRITFDLLLSQLEGASPQHIGDIGCGNGYHTHQLAAHFPNALIDAWDASPDLIMTACTQFAHPRIHYRLANGDTDTPPPADLLFANASLHWLQDFKGACHRFRQQLRPGGRLVASVFGPDTYWELADSLTRIMGYPAVLPASRFLTLPSVYDELVPLFDTVHMTQHRIQQLFPGIHALLDNIQKTGTRGIGLPGTVWTPGLIRELEHAYRSRFKAIVATYQVGIVRCQS